ncbi:MAG: cell division protein ZapA [Kiloniellales bacterium]|nr:cell division protein ZapA [Kiloniellales bacterium]
MAQVAIVINGRSYRVSCDEGQEERVLGLGHRVDLMVSDLVTRVGQVGEMQLLVMTALLLADELDEAMTRMETLEANAGGHEEVAAEALESCARRLEGIAARLEAV